MDRLVNRVTTGDRAASDAVDFAVAQHLLSDVVARLGGSDQALPLSWDTSVELWRTDCGRGPGAEGWIEHRTSERPHFVESGSGGWQTAISHARRQALRDELVTLLTAMPFHHEAGTR